MTEEQIYQKALEKANRNGWIPPDTYFNFYLHKVVIFSHEFAIAFFGREPIRKGYTTEFGYHEYETDKYKWQEHLEKMVVSPEPLRYLEQFL